MLHIILVILKTFGIIIASILGILLILMLLVLFIPIRYIVNVEKYDDFTLDGKIRWLFRFLYLSVKYQDNEFLMKFKVLGITLFDNKKVKIEKKVKKRKKSKNRNKIRKRNKIKKNKRSDESLIRKKSKLNSAKPNSESKPNSELKSSSESKPNNETKQSSESKISNELIIKNQFRKTQAIIDTTIKEEKNKINNNLGSQNSPILERKNNESLKQETIKEKQKLFKAVKTKLTKIKEKFKNFIHSFIEKIKSIFKTFENIKKMITKIIEFLKVEENKCGIKLIVRSLKKTLKHIFPLKMKGYLRFGTGDPCSTGQILAGISVAYPICKDNMHIIPDFENEIIEGKGFAKGRIRLITLLIICIKLILDNNFKQLLKNFKNFKEEL